MEIKKKLIAMYVGVQINLIFTFISRFQLTTRGENSNFMYGI